MVSHERISDIHTGRIPRASRAHTFYQAVADAPNPGPKRNPIWPPKRPASKTEAKPYSDDEMRGSY
jgi:hypothetical protein